MLEKIRGAGAAVGAVLLIAACAQEQPGTADASEAIRADGAGGSPTPVVLFLGTSLTAGQGVDIEDAFPSLVQRKIDSAGMRFRIVNAGVPGETSAGGLRRLDWLLRQRVDVLVLELGANDGLRGQDIDAMRDNLLEIITRTRETWPEMDIVMAGMEAPPNLGDEYTTRFRNTFRELADGYDAFLIPFLLEGVAAEPDLNQADGIHPNEDGHAIMAETAWRALEPILRRRSRN